MIAAAMERLTNAIPLLALIVIGGPWVAMAITAHRLLREFVERYPREAELEVPDAVEHMRHPRNLLFFFSARCASLLKNDPALWRRRQRMILLTKISIGLWIGGAVAIGVGGILLARTR